MGDESDDGRSEDVPAQEKPSHGRRGNSTKISRHIFYFGVHLVIFLAYTSIFGVLLRKSHTSKRHPEVIFSPAHEALHYEPRVFQHRINEADMGPYFGKPSEDLDMAWHKLLQYQNIHISKSELQHFEGRLSSAVEYPDGSGYMAQLQVYHDLHCLKRIHHTMWPEYYYPNLTDLEREELKFHNDHCLDTLRQSIQCHADITLLTMRWGHKQPIPLGNFSAPHECVNWDTLDGWSRRRSVDVMRKGWLKHPVLGPSFPDGRGVRTGVGHDD